MSGGRWWPAAIAALAAGVLASPAPAADPQLRLNDRPSQLRPGEQARVVARVDDLAACRLRLRVGARAAGSALANADGASQLVWRWRVAPDSGSARWRGVVECWADGASPPTGPAD